MRLSKLSPLFFIAFALTTFTSPSKAEPAKALQTLYVSMTPKHSVHAFINRWAGENYQITVTTHPIPFAYKSVQIQQKHDRTFYAVELYSATLPKLYGEIARLDRFAIIALGKHQHFPHFHHPFVQAEPLVGKTRYRQYPTTMHPIKAQKSQLHFKQNFAPSRFAIDPNFLKQKLSEYSGETPVKIGTQTVSISERGSTKGRELARAYLAQEYAALGFKVIFEKYNSGINFIAEKAGADPSKFTILSSHLDSVGNAGADDDGAGTISALAIAKELASKSIKHTLKIVAFDEEERGLIGSKEYARALDQSGLMNNLTGVFHIEMNGYNKRQDGAFHVIDCKENTSAALSQLVIKAIQDNKIQLKAVPACTGASDHSVFWKYNKPSIVVSENFFGGDGNPCYHKACDKINILDFNYMARIAQAMGLAVAEHIGSN